MSDEEEKTEAPGVEFLASDQCLDGIMETIRTGAPGDATITAVTARGLQGGLLLSWESKSIGFGELWIAVTEDGKVEFDTECMGAEFVKGVFAKFIDDVMAPEAQRQAALRDMEQNDPQAVFYEEQCDAAAALNSLRALHGGL